MSVFDPGLQPERTELAWRRTALALGVGSLIALRILPEVFGDPLWALGGIAGVVAATALWFGARRRYRTITAALDRDGDRAALPDGRMLAAVTVFVVLGGVTGLAIVVGVALI
ncbi:DUF202 domain-containing protein [Agromyces aerolatus]|uniref:DUF202 domain-containing protein n=1 Tax=Agromyces sp. LY-1074 TaxID=3074080 RepID=UPI00286173C8|nr:MULTISPECIES: DUF202 domain-containing protein [unclassified Agromyces]MDR5700910.1 DUF202 domain-containing protein [Agromyces sp. LY-1074]MDR5707429.1 DUF202 domain-containing protein [Agromyces sp. LY-1358]